MIAFLLSRSYAYLVRKLFVVARAALVLIRSVPVVKKLSEMKTGHVNKKWIVGPKHPWTAKALVLVWLVSGVPKKKTDEGR